MKNRILSIVLAVLTVLSVVPFTMLTTDASVPAWYAESVDFGDHFEGTWDGSASRVVHGYNVEKTTLDEKSVYKISVNPADFDEPNSPTGKVYDISKNSTEKHYTDAYKGFNLYRYNDSGKNYKDKDTGFNPKTEAEKTFYLVLDYKYVKTESPTADDVGVELDGSKMRWQFYKADNYFDGVADSADGIIADGEWHRTSFAFTPSETQGNLWLGQMAFLPLYGIGDNRMRIGDVLYIKNSVIVADNAAGAKPTDEVTVSFYESANSMSQAEPQPLAKKTGTVLTSIEAPAFDAAWQKPDGVGSFRYWQGADEKNSSVKLNAGESYILNTTSTENFYAVYAQLQTISFEGIATPVTNETGKAVTLPTEQDTPVTGKKLVGWKYNGNDYNLGATFTSEETSVSFTAVYANPISITFTGKDDANTTAYPGDTITIPGAPASGEHDGETFLGWYDGTKTYKVGATYTVGTANAIFTPKYATPQTVYLAPEDTTGLPDGAIVKTTLADADAYIADNGGVGTIYVYGTYNIDNTTFNSTDLTIEAYADAANGVIEFNTVTDSDLHGTNLKLTFDKITLKRADNPVADEQFTGFDGIDVTFGEGCTYATGTYGTGTVGIYFGHFGTNGTLNYADAKYTINAPFTASQFGVLMGYMNGNRTLTQNVEYVVNGGSFTPTLLVQNGWNQGNSDTIIGNITWTLNGGTFGTVSMGNIATQLSGTLKLTVNGGTFNKGLTFGISNDNRGSAQAADNVIYILNAKEITGKGNTVPEVAANNGNKQTITRGVSILNNAELADDISKHIASNATYRLAVKNGTADANVDANGNLKFTLTPDAAFEDGYDVYVGSTKVTANSDGSYMLTATANGTAYDVVQFVKKGAKLYTLNYKNGENTVKSEQVVSGIGISLKNVGITAPAGQAFKGYTDGTTEYLLGETYIVPADLTTDTITLTAVFEDFDGKTYYVSEGGSDSNDGHRKEAAFAFKTIVKAIETIGTGTGEILVTGNTQWGTAATAIKNSEAGIHIWEDPEVVTVNGNVTITFKDGATVARTSPDSNIKYVGTGSLKLVNIAEIYKVDGCTNLGHQHKVIPAISNFTLEGEYKIKLPQGYWSNPNFYPVSFPADKKVTLNLNGKFNILEFYDWGTTEVDGTIYINIGKDYDGQQFVIGGDSGGNTTGTTITNPIFITATDNNKGKVIQRGGNGSGSIPTITINGLQILNINSNITVSDTANKGNYTNNGGEYIINVPDTYSGITVASKELGKLSLTLPDGVTATLTNGENVTNANTTGDYTLTAGTTTVTFNVAALSVPVTIDGNETDYRAIKGSSYVLPAAPTGEAATAKTVGYVYDGENYACGATIDVPADATTVALTSIKVDMTAPVIYVDNTNGSDTNLGFVADKPIKNFARVTELIKGLDSSAVVTVKVIGEYTANIVELPTYGGKLIIDGDSSGKLSYGEALRVRSDVEFTNIAFNSTVASKHIDCYGHNVTFGTGIVTNGTQNSVMIHAGYGGEDYTGNEKIVINSGDFGKVLLGVYYIPSSKENNKNFDNPLKTWTGDLALEVNGGSVNYVTFGDGYEYPAGNYVFGTFKVDGNVSVTVNGGNVGSFDRGYLASATSLKIVTKPIVGKIANELKTMTNATVQCYNGVSVDNDGKLTEAAYDTVTNTNYAKDETPDGSFVLSKGQYIGEVTTGEGESAKTECKLPTIGAQLRLTGTDHALRFIAQVSKSVLNDFAYTENTTDGYGFIVIPTNVLQGAPLYNGARYTYNGKTYDAETVPAVKKFAVTDDYVRYTVALTGIGNEKADLTREYTVIPYIIKNEVYYYGDSYSCNLYNVAKMAKTDTETSYSDAQKEKINSIVETVDGPTNAD